MLGKCDDRKACATAFLVSLAVFGSMLFAIVCANGYDEESMGSHEVEDPDVSAPVVVNIPTNLVEQRMVQESIIEKQGDIQHDIDAIRAFLQDDIAAQSGEIPKEELLTIDEYVSQEMPVSNAQRRRSVESPSKK